MKNNTKFAKENFNSLLIELSQKYNINEQEASECVNNALSKAYGYKRVVFNDDGSITGLFLDKYKNKIIHHNISNKIYKTFKENLEEEFYKISFKKIEKKFNNIIKNSNNIFYGKIITTDSEKFYLELYDKNGNRLKNFFSTIYKKSKYIFKNELINKKYNTLDQGMLIYIPKRERVKQINGKFYIKGTRKHETIIRYNINSIFMLMKKSLGKSFAYKKCFINIKLKRITFFTYVNYSNKIKEFITEELKQIDDFEIIYIKE